VIAPSNPRTTHATAAWLPATAAGGGMHRPGAGVDALLAPPARRGDASPARPGVTPRGDRGLAEPAGRDVVAAARCMVGERKREERKKGREREKRGVQARNRPTSGWWGVRAVVETMKHTHTHTH